MEKQYTTNYHFKNWTQHVKLIMANRIYIITGAQGVGKSTIARKIAGSRFIETSLRNKSWQRETVDLCIPIIFDECTNSPKYIKLIEEYSSMENVVARPYYGKEVRDVKAPDMIFILQQNEPHIPESRRKNLTCIHLS